MYFYFQDSSIRLTQIYQAYNRFGGIAPKGLMHEILIFIDQHALPVILIFFSLAVIRFSEALGLWFEKRWAEWLTLVATLVYIPLELIVLKEGVRPIPLIVLIINLLISYYLYSLLRNNKTRQLNSTEPK